MLLVLTTNAGAQAREQAEPPVGLPIERWLAEPDEHLPGWGVHVDRPVLTFSMRLAVTLRAEASVQRAKLVGHDLHFFVKVADATGHWFPDRRYTSIKRLPRSGQVTATERFYAKSGDYQVALIIYDSFNQTHGVWRRNIHVPPDDKLLSFPSASAIEFIDPDAPFKAGSTPELPPLGNPKPLQVDVIVNLTERSELELGERHDLVVDEMSRGGRRFVQHAYPDWQLGRSRQDFTTESLLTIARVLDGLKVNGCVRVSVVDAVRSKAILDRSQLPDPTVILAHLKEHRDTQKVDAHILMARQQAGTFLQNFLQAMVNDNSGCSYGSPQIDRAIVLLSDALVFPESKQLTPVASPSVATRVTRFYFFRMTVVEYVRQIGLGPAFSATAMSPDDQIGMLLKDLDAHRFDLSQPKDFQKDLPRFLEELKLFGSARH